MKPLSRLEAEQLGWPALSVEQSREIDRLAIQDHGIAGSTLMENAGRGCADFILPQIQVDDTAVIILAGPGNNGGDGYIIARQFHRKRISVQVISLVPLDRLKGDALWAMRLAKDNGVRIETALTIENAEELLVSELARHGSVFLFDCMLGTGSTGAPREPMASTISLANSKRHSGKITQCIAIDLPSGFNGDSGDCSNPTFIADQTITFVAAKRGMMSDRASASLGQLTIIDIGIADQLKRQIGIPHS